MLSGEIREFLHADSVPQFLWERIRLGGNQFRLPCPLANHLRHINDLVRREKKSLVDFVESEIEARDDPREAFKEPFLDFDPKDFGVAPALESTSDEATGIDLEPIEPDLLDEVVFYQLRFQLLKRIRWRTSRSRMSLCFQTLGTGRPVIRKRQKKKSSEAAAIVYVDLGVSDVILESDEAAMLEEEKSSARS